MLVVRLACVTWFTCCSATLPASQLAQNTCGFFTAQVEHKLPQAVVRKVWFFLHGFKRKYSFLTPYRFR